jgi:hypothetical protein
MTRRPRQHTTPGQLCRIRPPVPSDEDESHYERTYETGLDGMIQDINEPVTVLTRFSGGQLDPLRFKWKNRVFDVDRVTGKWEEHDGQYKLYYFSVVTKEEDFYELVYGTRTMGWTLVRTDLEG